ncbi:MAG: hypothetical protein ACOYOT_05225 [Bacteroidales bacterium]
MKISVVISSELNDNDWAQITSGFNESFLLNKEPFELSNYYSSNELGYSYHAICRTDIGEIVAHSSIFPYIYLVNQERMLFGLSGGTFVLKAYRKEAFLYIDLLEELKSVVSQRGIVLTYGVSNENSFEMAVKLLGSVHLKDLKYYTTPVAFSKLILKKKIIFVDRIFQFFLVFGCFLLRLYSQNFDVVEKLKPLRLDWTEKFCSFRFGKKYKQIHSEMFTAIYRIVDEEGIKVAYIMDFRRKGLRSLYALSSSISHILLNDEIDLIIFVGELSFRQPLLWRVPRRFEPQRLPLTYDLLLNENQELRDLISNPKNWDFSLMNFDAR